MLGSSSTTFLKILNYSFFVYPPPTPPCGCMMVVRGWLSELVQSFYRGGPRDQTRVLGLRSRCLLPTKPSCWPGTMMSNVQKTLQLKVILLLVPQQPRSSPGGSAFWLLMLPRKCHIHNQLFVYPLQVWTIHLCIPLHVWTIHLCIYPLHVWTLHLCIHSTCIHMCGKVCIDAFSIYSIYSIYA